MDVGPRKGDWVFPNAVASYVAFSVDGYGSVTVTRTMPKRFLKPSSTV
jgi:hypothetical protein